MAEVLRGENSRFPVVWRHRQRIDINQSVILDNVLFHLADPFYFLLNFQVNTARRMESSSQPNKVQVPAKLLSWFVESGKGYWLTSVKGSSKCQWKRTPADVQSRYQEVQNKCFSFIFSWWNWYRYRWLWFHECWNKKDRAEKYFFFSAAEEISEEKLQRLMDWNVELCEDLLRPIIVQKKHRKLVGRAFNFQHVLLCGEPRIHVPGRWFHC